MSTDATSPTPAPPGGSAFPLTQWSVIVRAGDPGSHQAHSALEYLCRQYWQPLYAFVRRQGRSHHEAEDCTQEFLACLLAAESMGRARPELGKFRTFLLAGLRNFLTNEWRRTNAEKRGGGRPVLPLEFETAEKKMSREPIDSGLTPEQVFDRTWALGMIERALETLRQEYEKSGRGALFAALAPFVWGEGSTENAAAPAGRLAMTPHAFTVALHRLRQRLGQRLRSDVAETVAHPEDIDLELKHLIAAVSRRAADT